MKKKSVIITGASRGIGKAIALKYAQEGCQVSISGLRHIEELEDVRRQIESEGGSCLALQCDIGIYEQAKHFIDQSVQTFGTPDILINNAGISYLGLLQDMSCEEWEHLLRTNLTSVFYCCKLVIPHMLTPKQGRIINISSVWGNTGSATEVAYSATKGGINGFTRALAKELAPSNIQVNAVACGIIDTDMNAFLSTEEKHAIIEEVPAGRLGHPEEVADFVFQLTQSPSYLTGQIIALDGGWI